MGIFRNIHGTITRKLCVAIFILSKQKLSFFFFFLCSSIKSENRRVDQVLPGLEREVVQVGERWKEKEIGG
jgi:hypothetical protein